MEIVVSVEFIVAVTWYQIHWMYKLYTIVASFRWLKTEKNVSYKNIGPVSVQMNLGKKYE